MAAAAIRVRAREDADRHPCWLRRAAAADRARTVRRGDRRELARGGGGVPPPASAVLALRVGAAVKVGPRVRLAPTLRFSPRCPIGSLRFRAPSSPARQEAGG